MDLGCTALTLKHRETHGCVVSTVATDALVLKHQAISIHNADYTFIVLDQFQTNILHFWCTRLENKITFWKKWPSRLRVNGKTAGINFKQNSYKLHDTETESRLEEIHQRN